MNIWAIADLHLSFATPNKEMSIFGPRWQRHYEKIAAHWDTVVSHDDIVLIPGDISWAMKQQDAMADLMWIHERPGTKVIIRGNHDYWWESVAKVRKILPSSIHAIGHDAICIQGVAFAGARLWDTEEYHFQSIIDFKPRNETPQEKNEKDIQQDEKIFQRELGRLKMSLDAIPKAATYKIVLTHYPPIGLELRDSHASKLIEQYGVSHCVFGHLHSIKPGLELFGEKNNIRYHLVSCDYVGFKLQRIASISDDPK